MATVASDELLFDPLVARSADVLQEGQADSGAYVACVDFHVYRFGWLRDGSFCAYAMDLLGARQSSARFHAWVASCLDAHSDRVEDLIGRLDAGERPAPEEMLPARFTLDGAIEPPAEDPWPNFQLDGYGMWLWALEQHLGNGASDRALVRGVDLCARYLEAAWELPCWSWWEEFDGGEHVSTLGATAAGFDAAARLLAEPRYEEAAGRVRARIATRFVEGNRIGRGSADDRVDGSQLALAVPFGVVSLADPRMVETVDAIRDELVGPGGGVYRYRGDTYYGGGQWILLTCWLAWVDARAGRRQSFLDSRDWVRSQARGNGDLPEQVTEHSQAPQMVEPWIERWGPVASPLLWSHAMFVVMEAAGREAGWTSSR
jgi:GH15 family glucan-1,4-alpha-glucosidase